MSSLMQPYWGIGKSAGLLSASFLFLIVFLIFFVLMVTAPDSLPSVNVSLFNGTSDNATIILKSGQLFFHTNYSNNLSLTEENSTFKWLINNTNQSWGGGNRTAELVPMIYKDAVGYWHLDENGGTNGYIDSSGNGLTANPKNITKNVTGIIGGAPYFDGVKNWVRIPASAVLQLQQNFTVSMWFKLNQSITGTDDRADLDTL